MAQAIVNGVSFESDAPCEIHSVTWNGCSFRAGSFLLANLFAFQEWLDKKHPNFYVHVMQGGYNTGVSASAGTHDKDGCVDIAIVNRKTGKKVWARGERWLRSQHWYAWWRHTGTWSSTSAWHFHMIAVGIELVGCPMGTFVPGQIADARNGRTGLVGHLLDGRWRPPVYTPFPYEQWVKAKEDDMPAPKDWDAEDWSAFDNHVRRQVRGEWAAVQTNGRNRSANLVAIANALKIPSVPLKRKAKK